jgi:hypothetical protein
MGILTLAGTYRSCRAEPKAFFKPRKVNERGSYRSQAWFRMALRVYVLKTV